MALRKRYAELGTDGGVRCYQAELDSSRNALMALFIVISFRCARALLRRLLARENEGKHPSFEGQAAPGMR
eukprot:3894666-Rhodomonas_salina.2